LESQTITPSSNSIEARDDSNIMISYGTINFEELEMKKKMLSSLNINEVDVTPSRENVIWNTKTREAVKNVYLSSENGNRPNRR
jgi:hypothetical protein